MCEFKDTECCYICYDEKNNRLMQIVDKEFEEYALDMGAVSYHIPAMIDKEILEKCGYFGSFPHQLTVVAHAKPEFYEKISSNNRMEDINIEISPKYLTPAACLHIYPMLKNQIINKKIITTKARVYRYEDNKFNGKTRFWDFTVREIVFVGKSDYVLNCLEIMKDFTMNYSNKIGLEVKLENALDSFYPNKKNRIKSKLQTSNSLKFELITKLEDENVALASFNYHGTHFSQPFDFDQKGEIVTGCVGYGLERWVAALNFNKIDFKGQNK